MATCKDCLYFKRCVVLGVELDMHHNKDADKNCRHFKNKADFVEVKHGKWHIMPEDPYNESDCPTEEGWYRIITYDGEEMTDYYFGKPTLTGMGCVYWKNCKKAIRAWAKMDAERKETT